MIEDIKNIFIRLESSTLHLCQFGSQVEGATTMALKSDIDCVCCDHDIRVIQDWSDWEARPGKQLLMVRDARTSHGYCLLQLVRNDYPLPAETVPDRNFAKDNNGRVLAKHCLCLRFIQEGLPTTQHGPAAAMDRREQGGCETDTVFALGCDKWPTEADQWLEQETPSGWPTVFMKRYSKEHGCFLVPVASRTDAYPDFEWRISTSHAERCLMFSLNITQIRCYVLLKMILKSFIKPKSGEVISSFMCKTVLFHCKANSPFVWEDCSLVPCLKGCLDMLLNFVLTENFPHFIMPKNNLLAGKLTAAVKQQVVDILLTITGDIEKTLIGIDVDNLGIQLFFMLSGVPKVHNNNSAISVNLQQNVEKMLLIMVRSHLKSKSEERPQSLYQVFVQSILKLGNMYTDKESNFVKSAISRYIAFLSTSIGSLKSSVDIQYHQDFSPENFTWFSLGLNSDFASSKLKLASALYCAGELGRCELFLRDLERNFERQIYMAFCACSTSFGHYCTEGFERLCTESDVGMVNRSIAFCTAFLPFEINCVPLEMQYEMFRTSEHGLSNREPDDYWMDWAVVDSQPFLYFLQYKVYSQINRPEDQRRALLNLARTIGTARYLGHRDTALNLLGQCMVKENRKDIALLYYVASLNARNNNNVAIWHICIILADLIRQRSNQ